MLLGRVGLNPSLLKVHSAFLAEQPGRRLGVLVSISWVTEGTGTSLGGLCQPTLYGPEPWQLALRWPLGSWVRGELLVLPETACSLEFGRAEAGLSCRAKVWGEAGQDKGPGRA